MGSLRKSTNKTSNILNSSLSENKNLDLSDFSDRNISFNSFNDTKISKTIEELLYKHKKITKLYEWQVKCLKIPEVGKSRNLVYSLPTSGGKTLVAEILMLRQLTMKRKSVIFILPFISLVQEKVKDLAPFGLDLDFLVEEYASNKGKYPPTIHRNCPSVYFATIEKAHLLINSFIEIKKIDKIGMLVVDELHMIGDGSKRGANLELTLLKFMNNFSHAPIIGMSATLDNMNEMCQFLNAELFVSDFRPVELREYVKVDKIIFKIDKTHKVLKPDEKFIKNRILEFKGNKHFQSRDPDNVIGLVSEILPDKSCLIFCPTKKQCESLTNNIITLADQNLLSPPNKMKQRDNLLKLLEDECITVCPILKKSLSLGVAYHHSGLTQEERKIVEDGFHDGIISVICCTSTLAAGINVPARRVIIRSPYVGQNFITYSQYKQMTGRAGRAGFDTEGESIVMLNTKDQEKFSKLLMESSSKCESSLLAENSKMVKYFLLSAISLELNVTVEQIEKILENSLFNIQNPGLIKDILKTDLQYLLEHNMVRQVKNEKSGIYEIKSTELGRAVVRGNIDVTRAEEIYKELKNAEKSLNISTYLHLIYLVTPHEVFEYLTPDWNIYSRRMGELTEEEMQLVKILGFNEMYITRRSWGCYDNKNIDDYPIRRFYTSLILYDLWNQNPIYMVADAYAQPRGQIQSLLQSAVSFSACVSNFVEEFRSELWGFKDLFPKFTIRLSYCVSPELIPLMEVQGIKKGRANALFKSGVDSVLKLANSESKSIYSILKPISRKTVNDIISSAKMIIQEKVESLKEEVKDLIVINDDYKENFLPVHSTPKKSKYSTSVLESDLFEDCDIFISD